jgi:hypothetical protein
MQIEQLIEVVDCRQFMPVLCTDYGMDILHSAHSASVPMMKPDNRDPLKARTPDEPPP